MPEYFEDDEWRSQLFKWTSVVADLNPEEYSYRMGWIYADGLGCDQSYEKAYAFFHEVYSHGDWRGAQSIAKVYEEIIESNPMLDTRKKEELICEIKRWNKLADDLLSEETGSAEEQPAGNKSAPIL